MDARLLLEAKARSVGAGHRHGSEHPLDIGRPALAEYLSIRCRMAPQSGNFLVRSARVATVQDLLFQLVYFLPQIEALVPIPLVLMDARLPTEAEHGAVARAGHDLLDPGTARVGATLAEVGGIRVAPERVDVLVGFAGGSDAGFASLRKR